MIRTEDISTEEEFNRALVKLLRAGAEAGIDVSGAWECRNGGGFEDWEVLVTVLAEED